MSTKGLTLDVAHLVTVIATTLGVHGTAEGADIVLAVVLVVLVVIELLGILDGLAERKILLLVLEPGEDGATDILRLRVEVVDEAVICGRTLYLRGQRAALELILVSRAD